MRDSTTVVARRCSHRSGAQRGNAGTSEFRVGCVPQSKTSKSPEEMLGSRQKATMIAGGVPRASPARTDRLRDHVAFASVFAAWMMLLRIVPVLLSLRALDCFFGSLTKSRTAVYAMPKINKAAIAAIGNVARKSFCVG